MNSKFSKRLFAYLFDSFILLLLVMIVFILFPSSKISNLQTEFSVIEQNYLFKNITEEVYFTKSFEVMALMFKENIPLIFMNIIFIIAYHVVGPYLSDNQTLGMKILGIKIESSKDRKVSLSDLVIRNLFINGLFYLIACLGLYYVMPSVIFIITISILAIIQVLLVIISCFMIIYKKNKKGIQDIISDTKVVDC